MGKRIGAVLLTAGTVALMTGLGAAPSFARTAATWTVKPGGAVTLTQAGQPTITDVKTGNVLVCTKTKGTATFKSGSGLSGSGIGAVTALTFANCTGPKGLTFTLTVGHLPWTLNAVTFNPAITSGLTTGTATGMHAKITGTSCHATIDGTSATANDGTTQIHYHNSLAKLKFRTQASNLHFYNVSGCSGVIASGDAITFASPYHVSPAQTITSP